MPRINDPTPKIPYPGTLAIERHNNSVDVYYVPSPERLQERRASSGDLGVSRARLLQFDASTERMTIFPIRTRNSTLGTILEPKYSQIRRITLASSQMVNDAFHGELPSSEYEVMEVLEELPSCFVKDFDFGLGMTQRHKFIIEAVEELTECSEIVVSDLDGISVDADQNSFVISDREFELLRTTVEGTNTKGLADIRDISHEIVRNHIAGQLGQPLHLSQRRVLQPDTLSPRNRRERAIVHSQHRTALDIVSQNSGSIAKDNPSEFSDFQRVLQLVSFDNLIERFEEMMNKPRLREGSWQEFLRENDFALSSAFGYPVVQVHAQPSVGGRRLSGAGEKIADFLVKNSLTYNSAIVEIKKPQTKLLNDRQYRTGVFSPSRDLSGAINQALIQKYHFEQEIAQFKENSDERDLRTYSVVCFLLIGMMPTDLEQVKSFEIFRGNSKDVVVMTFDELLAKLKQLRLFLTLQDKDHIQGNTGE